MGSLERRVESLEAASTRGEARPAREALGHLSDEELDALEEALRPATWPAEEWPPPNEFLEKMKRWEAEATEQQRRNAEESRRRDRELLERNRALVRDAGNERRKE